MADEPSRPQVQVLVEKALASFPHEDCQTCECFLAYMAQLEMDADKSGRELLRRHKVDRGQVHSCLGCDPCPPADQYAQYLRHARPTPRKPGE